MRQQIYFWPENGRTLMLPIHYNHIVQAMIYDSLDEEVGDFLHEKGFTYGKRSFKMFTFSRLMATYNIDKEKEKIIFKGPVSLVVTSPYRDFCTSLANGLLLRSTVRLGNTNMQVTNVSFAKDTICEEKIKIRTLSPIVVYSTLIRPDGRKYTCYFEPG